MSELDDFRAGILAEQAKAEAALVQGDLEPRLALWSRQDPVSVYGAWGPCVMGWDEVSRIFRWVASRFSEEGITRSDFRYEVEVADVGGDMAYTVGFERFNATREDGTVEPVTLRVTHVYRREDGAWKIVHRHGDLAPEDESPPTE